MVLDPLVTTGLTLHLLYGLGNRAIPMFSTLGDGVRSGIKQNLQATSFAQCFRGNYLTKG